jgi:hypothetical protein
VAAPSIARGDLSDDMAADGDSVTEFGQSWEFGALADDQRSGTPARGHIYLPGLERHRRVTVQYKKMTPIVGH